MTALCLDNPPNLWYPIHRLVLSHSSITLFDHCARKLELAKFFGAPRVEDDNYAGDVGNALHRGFGKWLQTQDEKQAFLAFAMNFPFATEFLRPGQSQRSFEACYATMQALMHSHLLQPFEIAKIKTQSGELKDAIEVPFAITIKGAPLDIPIYYVGYIDYILLNNITSTFLVVDLKTTRSNVVDLGPIYQYDEQTIPYGIILEHVLGHSIEEMEVAYLSAKIDLLEPIVQLYPAKKTEDDIQDWLRGLFMKIDQIGKYYRNGWFPRASDGHACMAFNKACQFSDFCNTRDHATLNRIIQGEPRIELFPKGIEPWITAELTWQQPFPN